MYDIYEGPYSDALVTKYREKKGNYCLYCISFKVSLPPNPP